MLALAAADPVTEVATTTVTAIVRESVLGALLVVAVVLLVWLVRRVLAIQDLRVSDQKQMSDRLEKAQEKTTQLINTMTEAFSTFKVTLEKINQTQELSREAATELSSSVKSLQNTVDSVIREAVRGTARAGSYSVTRREPTSSTPPPRPRKE